MIEVKKIKKQYSYEDNQILNDISLNIERGQWCTIIGPSGTGKTTFLNCISGLLKPDQGEVIYQEINIYNLKENARSEYRRLNIGFVFQDYKLLPHYSVLDNVALPLIYDEPKANLYNRAKNVLDMVGIKENIFNRLPEGLSGGEKQRVAIARALIADPLVLICDEPTGNLDIKNRDMIIKILSDLRNNGKTIIMVTHDEEVADYGDITYKLYQGNLMMHEVTA